MPDTPEEKRGLNYWANPSWLCIHNRFAERAPYKQGNKTRTHQCAAKSVELETETGEILKFTSQIEASKAFEVCDRTFQSAITRMKRHPEHMAIISGKKYWLKNVELYKGRTKRTRVIVTIKTELGEVITFNDRILAGEYMDCTSNRVSQAINTARRKDTDRIRIKGKYYTVLDYKKVKCEGDEE
jgi:hypothetical protein